MALEAQDQEKESQKRENRIKESLYALELNCNKRAQKNTSFYEKEDIKKLTKKIAKKVSPNQVYEAAVVSLVQIESQFQQDARSDTGAIGLMQLTSSVCEDMYHPTRRHRYTDTLRSIYHRGNAQKVFSHEVWTSLELWNNDELPWENFVQFLWDHRRDPSVNLLIGNVYYFSLWKDTPGRDPVDRAILAAKNYNGSSRILKNGKQEKDIHAEKFEKVLRDTIDVANI